MIDDTHLVKILEKLPVDSPKVEVVGQPPSLIATITSGSFASMDEAARQELVWKHLRTQLGDASDLEQIEFIFTNTPEETIEAEAETMTDTAGR